jgi:DNA ligase-1
VKRTALTSRRLRDAFLRLSHAPAWLLDECYAHVGDTGETLALLMNAGMLPLSPAPVERSLHELMTEELAGLRPLNDEELDARLMRIWNSAHPEHYFLTNKLLTGAFRVGVSEKLVLKALAQVTGDGESVWHQWLMGKSDRDFDELLLTFQGQTTSKELLHAIPFCLAAPVEESFFENEKPGDYFAEWKWDGIRSQIIKKNDQIFIWSRGEEMVTEAFPEIVQMASDWSEDVILDGELLVWGEDKPRDFNDLQQRLGRKKLGAEILKKAPVTFMAYDILHLNGEEFTARPLEKRRELLESFSAARIHSRYRMSQLVPFSSWEEAKQIQASSREMGAEGLMLKNRHSLYVTGRKRGVWWKFKVDPYTLDAVLLYAQAGSGKRSNLFTDYTFALWEGDKLVPFAKAYSGLDNAEIEELDKWIRRNTLEKFGPVRSLKTEQVFEIGFEGIAPSSRHKSGIAVRFPRILRWRRDKTVDAADKLEDAKKLIEAHA